MTVINPVLKKAWAFVTVSHYNPSLVLEGNSGAYPSAAPCGTVLTIALLANIRLGWRWLQWQTHHLTT